MAAQGGHVGAVTVLMSLNAEFTVNKDSFHFFDYAITLKHKDLATAIVAHDRFVSFFFGISANIACYFISSCMQNKHTLIIVLSYQLHLVINTFNSESTNSIREYGIKV